MTHAADLPLPPSVARRERPHNGARPARPGTMPAAAPARTPRPGVLARFVDRLTRRWTVDLFDIDLQLEAGEIEADLRGDWH